ncbi:YhgE/Pip domain-containing protein [Companilactobacillus hulinensis]|uniref:YhgE/Pip domain-containing protein n=1 Tax=Companilactobacillus hulinensis TaxID=2486007 RepID=UPI000F7BA8F8|nr:YhgE/Pip domain-containing protein [Companilactobacillus hulinensis]
MLKAEWKYILKHKFLMLVLIVIMFIPSIYSVTFLKSMWNPYDELDKLPVAVIDHDKPITYHGTHLDVGTSLTKTLKHSSAMDFKILKSDKKAKSGLKNGNYYMIVTIPKNFSKNATTLMDNHPKKMVLNYETSAGHNYTASKMTATAAKQVAQEVSQEVTKSYSKTMFATIKQLSTGFTTASKGSAKLAAGDKKLSTVNHQITRGLNTLTRSSLVFSNGANTLTQGLNAYIAGVNQAKNGSYTLTSGLSQLSSKSTTLATGVGQLANGSTNLNSGIEKYASGVSELNTSTKSLESGTASLANGANKLSQSSNTLNSGMNQIYSASSNLSTQLQKVSDGLSSNSTNISSLDSSISNLKEKLSTDDSEQAATIKSDLNNLQKKINTQNDSNNDSINNKVSAVADQQGLTPTQKAAILDAVNSTDNTSNTSELTQAANTLSDDLTTMIDTQSQTLDNLNTLQSSINNNDQNNLSTVIEQLADGSKQLTSNIGIATNGMGQLNNGIAQLNSSSKAVMSGTSLITSGTGILNNNSANLLNGSANLATGINSMNDQMPTLQSGITQLDSGSQQLSSGLTTLSNNGSGLNSGANQLANGATQISNGATILADGSAQLGNGILQLDYGDSALTKTLAVAGKKSRVNPSKLTYEQVAKPATTKHTEHDDAPNNGTGMAPYMLSVSLFVGALAFNLMFDTYTPRKYPHQGMAWWFSKASVQGVFALVESTIVFALMSLIDGLTPIHPAATFGMILCTALVFMAIVGWLNLVLGKVGAFFSMILLVLQLGGSAGTYPIQLSNNFFNTIHPWLPMSYSVAGLRQTLMIGNTALPQMEILLTITVIFSCLSILFFFRRKSRINEIDFTKEASENSLT